jgi:hypothetical protein
MPLVPTTTTTKKTGMTLLLCLISLAVVSQACDHHSHHDHRQRQRRLRSGGGGEAVASASAQVNMKNEHHDAHAHVHGDHSLDCDEEHDHEEHNHEDQQEHDQEAARALASISNTYLRVGDFAWSSPQAFLDGGGRCHTREPEPEEVAQSDAMVMAFRKQYSNADGSRRRRLKTIVIPLYFHVLIGNNNRGDLSEKQILDQVDVMNEAFLPDFTFELKGTTRTVNNNWFTARVGSNAEDAFKAALRVGGPESLNLYTLEPGDGVLGWATLPTSAERRLIADGVCVHSESVPGGRLAPYNLGEYQYIPFYMLSTILLLLRGVHCAYASLSISWRSHIHPSLFLTFYPIERQAIQEYMSRVTGLACIIPSRADAMKAMI